MRSDAVLQRARRRRMPFEFGLAVGSVTVIVAALVIHPSVDTSRGGWGAHGGRGGGRGAQTDRLLRRHFRSRSAATPMSLRKSAVDDQSATTNSTAVNNAAIDIDKETHDG